MVRDPICGMEIDATSAAGQSTYRGQTYSFCSKHCQQKFDATPAHYADAAAPGEHHQASQKEATSGAPSPKSTEKYFCPMCENVETDQPGSCPNCGMALERNPAFPQPRKVIYTCPMHPEIEQEHPGSCPICGMALEPKNAGAGDEIGNAELREMRQRFWVGAVLSVPVFV